MKAGNTRPASSKLSLELSEPARRHLWPNGGLPGGRGRKQTMLQITHDDPSAGPSGRHDQISLL